MEPTDKLENKPTERKSTEIVIDLESIKPDPAKEAEAKLKYKTIYGLALGALVGLAGFIVSRESKNSATATTAVTSLCAIVGGALGVWCGSTEKTYEQQVYELFEDAAKNPHNTRQIQQNMINKLKEKDLEAAAEMLI